MIGIIGGSGFYDLPWLKPTSCKDISDTPYGIPSAPLHMGTLDGASKKHQICFLARHGREHKILPHRINYRANIQSMFSAGVKQIISINVVGACDVNLKPGSIVIPQQIIDYSWGREHTFFDESESFDAHIDFSEPFSAQMRERLLMSAVELDIPIVNDGVYGCTQGPRLETAAEIGRLQRDGCSMVGMTLMPEAALCRERGMELLSVCLVVNAASGVGEKDFSLDEVRGVMQSGMAEIERLICGFLQD